MLELLLKAQTNVNLQFIVIYFNNLSNANLLSFEQF